MATIRVYNVKHGDFILLRLDNDILVTRDFGSLDSYVNTCINHQIIHCKHCIPFRFTQCHLWNCFGCQLHNEAILTHPHSDHYSGYKIMYNNGIRKIYDRAYVPYLDLKPIGASPSFHSQQLKTALCFIATMPVYKTIKVQEWITVAPLMSTLSKQLIGVYQGCNAFNHWRPQGTVLWPPLPNDIYYTRRRKKLNDMLDIFSKDAKECADSVYGEISDILSSLFDKDNDIHGYDESNRNYDDFPFVDEDDKNDVLSKIKSLIDNIAGKCYNEENDAIEKMYYDFGTLIDNHSIAFSIEKEDHAALFLSDFHDSSMNRMVNFLTSPNFTFIKSAHHGTRLGNKLDKDLQKANPIADTMVHCCGPSMPTFNGPSYKYEKLASKIYCTDWNYSSSKWRHWPPTHQYVKFNSILFRDWIL
ncbi:MAG: hypothetical protein KBT57_04765 [bacterium]|nr:hypothetical protein [Candidatus Limimorpha equi]